MTTGQHSSGSDEWVTPPEIVDPARALFGGFDLDPASCAEANTIVKARRILTREDDGLSTPWAGNVVWVNGPSKKSDDPDERQTLWKWWCHGARAWRDGAIKRLWFVVFNPSSFLTAGQRRAALDGLPTPQHAARVEFRDRVRFCKLVKKRGRSASYERGAAPPHGSALLLLTHDESDYAHLVLAYRHLGETLVPYRPFGFAMSEVLRGRR